MGRKIKYNIDESRWELLAEDGSVISYAVGHGSDNPWELTGDNAWKHPNEVTITAGGTVDATAVDSNILEGKTAFARGRKLTGTLPYAEEPTVEDNTVTAHKGYLSEDVTITIDHDSTVLGYYTEDGMFQGIDVSGTDPVNMGDKETLSEGSVFLYTTGQSEPEYVVITSAVSADVVDGKTAVLNGVLVTGSMPESVISKNDDTVVITHGYVPEDTTVQVDSGVELPEGITVSPADVLDGVFYIDSTGNKVEGTMPTVHHSVEQNVVTIGSGYIEGVEFTVGRSLGATEYTPGTTDQQIESDTYLTGVQTIKGDSHLVGSNIKKGTTIFGVQGTYEVAMPDLSMLTPDNIRYGVTIDGVTGDFTYEDLAYPQDVYAEYIAAGIPAYINGQRFVGSMPNRGDYMETITTVDDARWYRMDYGYYSDITIEVSGAANIKPENIKKGVKILDVTGTLENGVDTSDATATASDMLSGITAYVDGEKITGTISINVNKYLNPATDDVPIPTGYYDQSFISGDRNLTAANIKKGITIFGVDGTLESGIDTSDATALDYTILAGFTAYGNGAKIVGTMPDRSHADFDVTDQSYNGYWWEALCEYHWTMPGGYYGGNEGYVTIQNLEPSVIKAGTTIKIGTSEIVGEYEGASFDFSAATSDFSAFLAVGQKAYNEYGVLEEGTMEMLPNKLATFNSISELDGANKNKKWLDSSSGYVSSDGYVEINGLSEVKPENIKKDVVIAGVTGTYEGESAGGTGMEFYECASVSSGEAYTGNIVVSGRGDPDGVYTPTTSLSFTDKGWTMTNSLATFYITLVDGCWTLWEGYIDDPMTYARSTNTNPSATAQEICSSAWTKGTFTAEVDSSVPTGTPTWSGYKMAWSEGQAGDGIIVSGASGSSESGLNGEYSPDTNPYSSVTAYKKKDGVGPNGCAVWISYGGFDGSPAWILWEDEVSMHFYKNESAGQNASISEICAGPWVADWGGSANPIPTFAPTGSPAGWAKTEELVEGLEIKGYTPEVGKVYAFDSTINGNMYPAEISSGSSSGGTSEFPGIVHTNNIMAPSQDVRHVIMLLGSPSAPANSLKSLKIYHSDTGDFYAWRNGDVVVYQDDSDFDGTYDCYRSMDEDSGDGVFRSNQAGLPWEVQWEDYDGQYNDIICIAWSFK